MRYLACMLVLAFGAGGGVACWMASNAAHLAGRKLYLWECLALGIGAEVLTLFVVVGLVLSLAALASGEVDDDVVAK